MRRKFTIAILCATLIGCSILPGCGKQAEEDKYSKVDKSLLFGMDEPISEGEQNGTWESSQINGFSMEATTYFASAIGCKSFRFRVPDKFITAPEQYSDSGYEYLKNAIQKFHDAGVENLIGTAMIFPQYTAFRADSANSAPTPDDLAYGEWLEAVSDMWESLAALFPEITTWEVGNEFNADIFFHPNGFQAVEGSLTGGTGGFSEKDHAKVVTDYMYYASKGVKKGNPDAKSAMPSPGPLNGTLLTVQYFIDDVYTYIESGDAPYGEEKSKDPDDYFDFLGWHPYTQKIDETWLKENNDIYQVAIDHGDEGKPVLFTEFGFTDFNVQDQEKIQSSYLEKAFEYMASDQMPYVETCCEFRMYTCAYAENWGGLGEVYFGCISEQSGGKGLSPRDKAYTIQKIYGGTGDLTKYE